VAAQHCDSMGRQLCMACSVTNMRNRILHAIRHGLHSENTTVPLVFDTCQKCAAHCSKISIMAARDMKYGRWPRLFGAELRPHSSSGAVGSDQDAVDKAAAAAGQVFRQSICLNLARRPAMPLAGCSAASPTWALLSDTIGLTPSTLSGLPASMSCCLPSGG